MFYFYSKNLTPTLINVNEAVYVTAENQNESSIHPYQDIEYRCRFNLNPIGYRDSNNYLGDPNVIISNAKLPLMFNSCKIYVHCRKLKENELKSMLVYEITLSMPC